MSIYFLYITKERDRSRPLSSVFRFYFLHLFIQPAVHRHAYSMLLRQAQHCARKQLDLALPSRFAVLPHARLALRGEAVKQRDPLVKLSIRNRIALKPRNSLRFAHGGRRNGAPAEPRQPLSPLPNS